MTEVLLQLIECFELLPHIFTFVQSLAILTTASVQRQIHYSPYSLIGFRKHHVGAFQEVVNISEI